jgi:hypothetical protein
MRINKQNYNELRTQELDNNYAKVWHVNEIREELLANTPEAGGVTSINDLSGAIIIPDENIESNIRVTTNTENNTITFDYVTPYDEFIFKLRADQTPYVYTIYSSNTNIVYSAEILIDNIIKLTPNVPITYTACAIQLTIDKSTGTPTYVEIPYVIEHNAMTGIIKIGVDHSSNEDVFDGTGLKSSLFANIKFTGLNIPT